MDVTLVKIAKRPMMMDGSGLKLSTTTIRTHLILYLICNGFFFASQKSFHGANNSFFGWVVDRRTEVPGSYQLSFDSFLLSPALDPPDGLMNQKQQY